MCTNVCESKCLYRQYLCVWVYDNDESNILPVVYSLVTLWLCYIYRNFTHLKTISTTNYQNTTTTTPLLLGETCKDILVCVCMFCKTIVVS